MTSHCPITAAELASLIDHTILKPDATVTQVRRFCDEARQHKFRAVCVSSLHVPVAYEILRTAAISVCSVVAFPFGAMLTSVKVAETVAAVSAGAQEIDMVIAIGALKVGSYNQVSDDILAVRNACGGGLLKVIIETCLLTDEEKRIACDLAVAAGADFVKTSTGFSAAGATVHDVALMRAAVGTLVGVKASGGIRSLEVARAMIAAGATRIGSSSSVALMAQIEDSQGA
jgi:deoxyribose-phosphate aldolase